MSGLVLINLEFVKKNVLHNFIYFAYSYMIARFKFIWII